MRIVVLADTHAPRRWKSCPAPVAAHLRGADLILHAVRGNNDGRDVAAWGAPDTLQLDLEACGLP